MENADLIVLWQDDVPIQDERLGWPSSIEGKVDYRPPCF